MNYKKLENKSFAGFDLIASQAAHVAIIDKVIALHASMPTILGIFLSGTLAGKPRDQHSDLDFIAVYQGDGPSAKSLEQIRTALGVGPGNVRTDYDISTEYGISSAFDLQQIEICLIYYNNDYLTNYIRSYYSGSFKKCGAFYPGSTIAALAENPILFANGDSLKELKASASSYPEEAKLSLCRQELGWFDYYLEKLDQFLFRQDRNGLQLTFSHAVDSALNVIFAINAIPYSGPGKAFEAKIDRLRLRPEHLVNDVSIVHTGFDSLGHLMDAKTRSDCLERLLSRTRTLAGLVFDSPGLRANSPFPARGPAWQNGPASENSPSRMASRTASSRPTKTTPPT
jgi:hypothetical protein